jgi:2,3-bisphosphoglycerate-dependent phosphoglycerate mutase
LDATVRAHFGKTIVVACHGGVIDAILRRAVHAPATGKFEFHTRNCSLTEMVEQRDRHWAVIRYNDHAHLHDLPEATPSE